MLRVEAIGYPGVILLYWLAKTAGFLGRVFSLEVSVFRNPDTGWKASGGFPGGQNNAIISNDVW